MNTPTPTTLTYKTVSPSEHEIKLDLYLPTISSTSPWPIVLRLHGGGLLQGNRGSVPPHMLNGMSKHGYALISADYRLAPQTRLLEILSDVLDCLTFIQTTLPSIEEGRYAKTLDVNRITLLGSSAGGYLALLAALHANPRPKVVLAIYPITNPFGDFFSRPHPHPLGQVERSVVAPFLDPDGAVVSDPDPGSERSQMYFYMLQEANLAELLGLARGGDEEEYAVAKAVRKYVGDGKVGKGLPLVYIVHGDADKLVGVDQSDEVVQVLEEVGAEYEYERVAGVDHLYDRDEAVQMDGMYEFMKKHW